jgi:ribosome recycling factor
MIEVRKLITDISLAKLFKSCYSLDIMDTQFIPTIHMKMQKAIAVLQEDLGTIRTGRATPALVENVVISAYENTQHLRIKEMATISTDGPRMIIISPFDPSIIRDLERGISSANLGYTGAVDGNLIRISIPPLTAERREEYVKLVHAKIEGGRVMIRQIRHDAMMDIKRQFEVKAIGEDEKKRLEKEIQTHTDNFIAEIEVLKEKKETELREV